MHSNQEIKLKRLQLDRNLWPLVFHTSKFAGKIESCGRRILEYIKFFSKRVFFVFLPQKHILRKVFIFLFIFAWIFSGWPRIWKNSKEITIGAFANENEELVITLTNEVDEIIEIIEGEVEEIIELPQEEEIQPPELQVLSTSTSELLPSESPKLNPLIDIFIGFLKALFGDDNVPEEKTSEDAIIKDDNFGGIRSVIIMRNTKTELWLESENDGNINWQKMADGEMISAASPLGFQDSIIFWLSADEKAVVGHDSSTNVTFSQTIEPQGTTMIEYNFKKYILSIGNGKIIVSQVNEESF